MKSSSAMAVPALIAAAMMAGCEWTGSSNTSGTWNDRYDVVNFSATYRGPGGAAVARSASAGSAPAENGSDVRIRNEHIATSTGGTRFSGTLKFSPLVVGSLGISAGGLGLVDNGSGELVDAAGETRGAISYSSGAWTIDLSTFGSIDSGTKLYASYNATGSITPDTPIVVQTITVQQTGQHLTMQASNGMTFTGTINGMNVPRDVTPQSVIVAKFTVRSESGDRIVGTLTDSSSQRILSGSWVRGRETLDVQGVAPAATRRPDLLSDAEGVTVDTL